MNYARRMILVITALLLLASSYAQDADMRQFDGTTLNLLYFELPYLRGVEELLPEFTEQTGINVNFEFLSETAAYQKIQFELASGTGNYDIVGNQSGFMPLFIQNDWLTPVESFFGTSVSNADLLDIDDFVPST